MIINNNNDNIYWKLLGEMGGGKQILNYEYEISVMRTHAGSPTLYFPNFLFFFFFPVTFAFSTASFAVMPITALAVFRTG